MRHGLFNVDRRDYSAFTYVRGPKQNDKERAYLECVVQWCGLSLAFSHAAACSRTSGPYSLPSSTYNIEAGGGGGRTHLLPALVI